MDTATVCVRAFLASATLSFIAATAAAHDDDDHDRGHNQAYRNEVLVSNGAVPANFTDPNLANAWGVAFNPTGFVWVNDAKTGKATLYDGTGRPSPPLPAPLVVSVPAPDGSQGEPTGIVFSGGTDFLVSKGTATAPARFIFVTTQGGLSGWAPQVDVANAIPIPKPDGAGEAVYTGLALSGNGTTHLLYAANFLTGHVDVFDGTFKPVSVPGGFIDRHLPPHYSPFGIQAINGDIYVTYARQDANGEDEVQGPGLGFVNVFDPEGRLLRRIASRGVLNAPWGIALAPESFGEFGGALLVGNLGDGTINAFGPRSGKFLGSLRDTRGRRLHIDGLWGFQFGNGISEQKTNALYYAAGPNDEEDGVYGVITAVTD